MSANLKDGSALREAWNTPFAELDDLIQQIDDRYIEIRPNPAVPAQTKLAQTLSDLINSYKDAKDTDDHNHRIMMTRAEDRKRTFYEPVDLEEAAKDTQRRIDLATDLEPLLRATKIQGMVHDGTRATEELKECQQELSKCQEENRKFSRQILEYKNKVGLRK